MRIKIFALFILVIFLLTGHALALSPSAIPVLMYHSVSNIPNNAAVISPVNFEKQMQFLAQNGYHTLTLDELYSYLSNNTYKLPSKPIVITFDDGYRDTFTTVLPILKKNDFKAALFLITSKIDKHIFSLAELEDMSLNGMSVYSHTYNHADLKSLSTKKQEFEIATAEQTLKNVFGKKPLYFCPPYSHYNNNTLKILKKRGYKMSFTNLPGWVKKGDNPFALKRVYVGNNLTLTAFKERIQNPNYTLLK